MHILVTRPEADAAGLAAQLQALGHTVSVDPLLEISPLPVPADSLAGAVGLIATSRNGLRALAQSPALEVATRLPLIAVGSATAELARKIGFTDITTGEGTAASIVPLIEELSRSQPGPLVHIRGEAVAYDLAAALRPRGVDLSGVIVYRAVPADTLQPSTRDLLAKGEIDAVILMSPRTGATFARLAETEGLAGPARKTVLICLSQAVATAVEPLSPERVEVTERPDSAAVLAAVTRVATLWSGV